MEKYDRTYICEAAMGELKTRLQRLEIADPGKARDDWNQILHELVHKIQEWLPKEEWSSKLIHKDMEDSRLGEYKAPALIMQREFTRIMVEPITRFAPGTDGVVDIYKMPAYDDIASLYRIDDEWKLHYAYRAQQTVAKIREGEGLDLNKENFLRVLNEISGHAAE
jgi:hypothetical protein